MSMAHANITTLLFMRMNGNTGFVATVESRTKTSEYSAAPRRHIRTVDRHLAAKAGFKGTGAVIGG